MTGDDEAPKKVDEESIKVPAPAAEKAPLKVLHVYSGNLYGGIETMLRTLAEERAQCPEMEPEFALCFEGRLADEIRASGAPLHMLGGVRLSRPWQALRAQARLRRVIVARQPDVVVCHAVWPYVTFGPIVLTTGAHLAFYQHDIGEKNAPLNRLALWLRPDVYVANSKYTATHAFPRWSGLSSQIVNPPVRLEEVRLSADERRVLRASLGADDDDVVILQVSRFQKMKGHLLLLDAVAKLENLPWRCWFVGQPQRTEERSYADFLRARAKTISPDRIRFIGQTDVPRIMKAADIFCQPNLAPESFGLVFVEARNAGLPAITTSSGGAAVELASLVSPDTGSDSLAALLRQCIQGRARRPMQPLAISLPSTLTELARALNAGTMRRQNSLRAMATW